MKHILIAVVLIFVPSPLTRSQTKSSADSPSTIARNQYVNISRIAVLSLKTDLNKFHLSLEYHGPEKDKHSLYLSVEPPERLADNFVRVLITKEQALMIIGHLAGDGFLYRGTINSMKQMARPEEPYYFLSAGAQSDSYFEFIPCGAQPYRWHGMMRPAILEQMKMLRAVLTGDAGEAIDKLGEPLACPTSTAANKQTLDEAWKSVVYADWDRATRTSSLRVNDFLLQDSGKSRRFEFGSLWRYHVSLQKWERVDLRVNQPIALNPVKRQIYSRESDQKIVGLTGEIGLFWAEWKEDGRGANTLIFAGPLLCEDVHIGDPPEGMIATCVPFANSARAMFVPDPLIHCKR